MLKMQHIPESTSAHERTKRRSFSLCFISTWTKSVEFLAHRMLSRKDFFAPSDSVIFTNLIRDQTRLQLHQRRSVSAFKISVWMFRQQFLGGLQSNLPVASRQCCEKTILLLHLNILASVHIKVSFMPTQKPWILILSNTFNKTALA